MIMEQILIYALVSGVAFWLGMKTATAWNTLAFRKVLEDLGVTSKDLRDLARREGIDLPEAESTELPVLEIRLEKQGDMLYAYRLDNDQFLAQGSDREALIQRLTENLVNVKVIIDQEHGADLIKP